MLTHPALTGRDCTASWHIWHVRKVECRFAKDRTYTERLCGSASWQPLSVQPFVRSTSSGVPTS